jgi:5-methylcytosine-specific restriction endonuclease McrA
MYPLDVWCKISCVKDNQSCIFENNCPHRKMFLRSFKRKQVLAIHRHAKKNGRHDVESRRESYIPYSELLNLARTYMHEGFRCYYCGRSMSIGIPNSKDTCSLDHRAPIANGGANEIENIVLCCERCNIKKGVSDNYGK